MTFTLPEQIATIEALIVEYRWSQPDTEPEKYRAGMVLKAIAGDLRARMPGEPSEAIRWLDRRIHNAKVAKTGGHYPVSHMVGIAQELIGRWATIKAALEQFETAQEAAE